MRISSSKEKYLNEVFGLSDADLTHVRGELVKHKIDFMAISGHEGRFLQFLIRAFNVKRIVEVGTLFGFSSLCMAKALPDDGEIFTLEKNPTNHATAERMFKNSPVGHKIRALCGDAVETLKGLSAQGPFDLVFIDADKAGYVNYLDWAEENVRRGGLIVGDNTFLFGALWGEAADRNINERQIAAMKEFNQRLADSSRYNSIMIPTAQGMTVGQKL